MIKSDTNVYTSHIYLLETV